MPFLPIRRLRAQHFVRAFEVDGRAATVRAYAPSLTDRARFTELDLEMDWAVAELRKWSWEAVRKLKTADSEDLNLLKSF